MKIIVEVPDYEAKQVAGEATAATRKKKFPIRRAAKEFAQNLIDRYFSVEHLDTDIFAE